MHGEELNTGAFPEPCTLGLHNLTVSGPSNCTIDAKGAPFSEHVDATDDGGASDMIENQVDAFTRRE
jgi:hypothetical protein